jgi:hypothetical protein
VLIFPSFAYDDEVDAALLYRHTASTMYVLAAVPFRRLIIDDDDDVDCFE